MEGERQLWYVLRKQMRWLNARKAIPLLLLLSSSSSSLTDCENMGGANEFFDKFSVRYHISTVMAELWKHTTHRSSIITESRSVSLSPL